MVANRLFLSFVVICAAASPAFAQATTGSITGHISDQQGAAIPGVTVHAVNGETGFERIAATDEAGNYRLAALPVGTYDVTAQFPGFRPMRRTNVAVNISRTSTLDGQLEIEGLVEEVAVSAAAPSASMSSSVGEVVSLARIQALPLNGRQFANLAATVPGVSLGFHSDLTKSAQYAPQISGGNGRNVNYVVDGGDNNDDTVGGLLQLFPLEAIQEFDVVTQRFDAEYGRSNGAVLNVVTRSGTNELRGSWFTLFRDDSMNARTFTERRHDLPKQPYERIQLGGSFGGPLLIDRAHYFAAYERTQQDTKQPVDTLDVFPADEGLLDVPLRQDLFTVKVTGSPRPEHYVAVRYGRDHNSQPTGTPRMARSTWAHSTNTYDSINLNHNWVVGQRSLNELVVQYSRFDNRIPAGTPGPTLMFPNNVIGGANPGAPQRTEQTKWQYRNDFSRMMGGAGLAHEVKAGVNWVHEPVLRVFTGQGLDGIFIMGTLDPNGPVSVAMRIGGNPTANIPLDLLGFYAQDDWRVSDRLTLNLGVRWDYVDGMPIDQSGSANFLAMQAAGRSGRFAGTILDDFGGEVRKDTDNWQPRIGAVYNVGGTGRNIVRGGWGIYTDLGYTSSNALTAAFDAARAGIVFSAADPGGLRKLDGSFFRATDPLEAIAHLNAVPPGVVGPAGEVVSPLLEQPYSYQSNVGWAHQLTSTSTITADYVRVQGRDLNMRVRPNVLVNGRPLLVGTGVVPMNSQFRTAISQGSSEYNALILAMRRRMSSGFDLSASYTLAKATSDVGTASDEIAQNLIQDISDPFADVQQGPSARTDSRHTVSVSAIVQAPWGISVAPILYYRSALPVHTFEGVDLNRDGNAVEITPLAYRYTGLTDQGAAAYEEAGRCETVNCSRRAPFSQLNLRVSKAFPLPGPARIEAIAEIFNLFNASNPSLAMAQRRLLSNGLPNPGFMQPAGFAGDVGQPEQRVGQIGFRLTF
jgi:outer membrane receptor protein involved in Fe transport